MKWVGCGEVFLNHWTYPHWRGHDEDDDVHNRDTNQWEVRSSLQLSNTLRIYVRCVCACIYVCVCVKVRVCVHASKTEGESFSSSTRSHKRAPSKIQEGAGSGEGAWFRNTPSYFRFSLNMCFLRLDEELHTFGAFSPPRLCTWSCSWRCSLKQTSSSWSAKEWGVGMCVNK